MNTLEALHTIECDECATEEQYIEAMQHLIDTAVVWRLQGCYGRTAVNLIEAGVCTAPEYTQ